MRVELEILTERVELVDADALLVPVDGALCRLGGASAGALRAALPEDERADELEYVEDALARLRPLRHPEARVIDARDSRVCRRVGAVDDEHHGPVVAT